MTFSLDANQLRPFAVTTAAHREHLHLTELDDLEWIDALEPSRAPFHLAMNRANCQSYDGEPTLSGDPQALGMPLWTLLDCCLLPSVVVGFHAARTGLPRDFLAAVDPEGGLDHIGVSEFIAIPSLEATRVVGISLFSSFRGHALGRRSKALGLYCLQAARQAGVTQFSNPSVRLHLAFGPLRVIAPRVDVHSRPGETFVYELEVPESSILRAMLRGTVSHAWDRRPLVSGATWLRVGSDGRLDDASALRAGDRIVDARIEHGRVTEIAIRRD